MTKTTAKLNKTIALLAACLALTSFATPRQGGGHAKRGQHRAKAAMPHAPGMVAWPPDATRAALPAQWMPLLDDNLANWEKWIGVVHTSVDLDGVPKSDDVRNGTPLGLGNDPKNVFSVIDENGEKVLKITGEIYGGLTTKQSYANYHFSLQFRWGTQKYEPRLNAKRDSGILYHCKGPHGAFWNVWKASLEMQVQEGDCGDYFGLAGAFGLAPAKMVGNQYIFAPRNTPIRKGRIIRSVDNELPNGQWNTLEVITIGDRSIHLVNGVLVNALQDARYKGAVLNHGQIQIQSEGAEVYYKDIKIRAAQDFPAEHLATLGWPPQGGGNDAVPFGKTIALKKTGGDEKYVTAEKYANDNQLLARAAAVGPWEQFRVERHPLGGVALLALANNKYVQTQGNNASKPLRAKGEAPGTWEQFEWKSKGPGMVALKSTFANQWVGAAWPDDNALLYPNGAADGDWETFRYEVVASPAGKAIGKPAPKGGLTLYPNPAQGTLYVAHAPAGAAVKVVSIDGRQAHVTAKAIGHALQLDISALPKGTYVLKINRKSQVFVKQ